MKLLIYGFILFPTYEDLIDFVDVSILWDMLKETENLVPALLADVFHTLHLCDEKRNGIIVYCLPLLYIWLTSNVFKAEA